MIRTLESFADAERRVCAALAGGAVFNVQIFNGATGTVFQMHREDGIPCEPDECLALVMSLGVQIAMRVQRGAIGLEDVQ